MENLEFHLSNDVALLPSIEMLLNEWKSILSQDQSSPILQQCAISLKRSPYSKPRLILMVELGPPTTSGEQTQRGLAHVYRNLVRAESPQPSHPSSDPS